MGHKDLHDSPFDESTIAKLEIFEDYAQAWIPTWVMQGNRNPEIHIFDFFSGTGYDKNEIAGSPIRILKKVQEQKGNLFQKEVKIVVHLNEFKKKKFEQLKSSCDKFMNSDKSLSDRLKVNYYNKDFEALFSILLPYIKKYPSLVYLDQNGIKFVSEKYFLKLEKTSQTDFLYFISSAHVRRFGKTDGFKIHLDINMEEIKKHSYNQIHRAITEQLRKKLPANTRLKLYPFSLKKGANIHGIVFGATHPRAVDKFLTIGWKRNGINGDANFDIDDEASKTQLSLFEERKLSKVADFQTKVRDEVLSGVITNNFQMLNFVYEHGHIGEHARCCLEKMKAEGKIAFVGSSSPCVNYDNVYKKKNEVKYQRLKK